jgi:peptidoglycan/LPS O-acetylase OafA/YrhL
VNRPASHIPALDGFRALAIACVLFTHFWTYPTTTPLVNRLAAAGWVGVDLFFVLSGFLITRILLASRTDGGYYRSFYARRVLRIFPAYYLLLAIVFLALPRVAHSVALRIALRDWHWYALYLSNVLFAQIGWQLFLVDVTWSVAVEEQFYLAWPILVRGLSRKALLLILVGICLVLPLVRWGGVLMDVDHRALDLLTVFRLDSLALGAVVACLESPLRGWRPAVVRWTGAASAGAVLVLVLFGAFGRTDPLTLVLGHTLLAVVGGALIVRCLDTGSRVAAWFCRRPMRAAGRVSYGLYLFHPLTLMAATTVLAEVGVTPTHLTSRPALNGALHVALMASASYGVAWVSFRYFESPILALKTRFTTQNRSRITIMNEGRKPALPR